MQAHRRARGLIAGPGLVDLNVSLREPCRTAKAPIDKRNPRRCAGGVTSLWRLPRTFLPVLDYARPSRTDPGPAASRLARCG